MIIVAVVGLLAAIAIPKFSQLIMKGNEASTRGNLAALRTALSVYCTDCDGYYPTDTLASLTVGAKYLPQMPVVKIPSVLGNNIGHPDSAAVSGVIAPNDAGGWAYDNNSNDNNWGGLWVNCTHSDTKGALWTSY